MDASFSNSLAFVAPQDDNENGSQMRHQEISSGQSSAALAQSEPPKRRRNQPPNPDDAEIIVLSPTSLMKKNGFVCDVCHKGFQREQNLQLHRRGHSLPWNLKAKGTKEVKRKLYLCPEKTCPNHNPTRALGDLTGIKKHYSRKHGEKKFKCEKCTKKYAVLSDCKAHAKTCGTRDYRCDCGTIFSRRDSFITHRTFCGALAQQNGEKIPINRPLSLIPNGITHPVGLSTPHHHQPLPSPQHHDMLRLGHPGPQYDTLMSPSFQAGPSTQQDMLMSQSFQAGPSTQNDILMSPSFQSFQSGLMLQMLPSQPIFLQPQVPNHTEENQAPLGFLPPRKPSSSFDHGLMQFTDQLHFDNNNNAAASSSFANLLNLSFFPGNVTNNTSGMDNHHFGFGDDSINHFSSGNFMSAAIPSLYSSSQQAIQNPSTAQMSATALLQKAAQYGSTSSTNLTAANPLIKLFDTYQPESHNADNFGAFGDNRISTGSSSSMFGGAYTENVQDVVREDQYYDDKFSDKLWAAFDGEGIGFGILEPDEGMTRDFLGIGQQQVENTNVGDVDISSLDSQNWKHDEYFGAIHTNNPNRYE